MISDALLEELRYKGEGSDLDYKSERYAFAGASDDQKSELLKDILAFANSHRSGTAYILLGFRESAPNPAEVVGLESDGAIDDSRLQEFVNSKLDTRLEFRYDERLFKGKNIAVISIPKQKRPFYTKKDFGKVKKEQVYIRRGSATAVASPREIAAMGEANFSKGKLDVAVLFQGLEDSYRRTFYEFPKELPDLERLRSPLAIISPLQINRDFWRQMADYRSKTERLISSLVQLENKSNFSLTSTHLELTCIGYNAGKADLSRADHVPDKPESSCYVLNNLSSHSDEMYVDDRGAIPVMHFDFGTVRPGQVVSAFDDLVLLPSKPGLQLIEARLYANEIEAPVCFMREIDVTGDVVDVSANELFTQYDSY